MSEKKLTDPGVSLALALSGGGFRASLFHLGALRRLNDAGLLSRMRSISSVSGGSILNGLLACRWPCLTRDADGRFTNFESQVEEPMRQFCGKNLRNYPLIFGRLDPRNWERLIQRNYSATNLLAERYTEDLFGGARIGLLREIATAGGPAFVFCATNLSTGVNWIFAPDRMGDYQAGYTSKDDLDLGIAVAASSAFPLAFPPLVLELEGQRWSKGDLPDVELRRALRKRCSLTDGGVYDNMGLEPIWKDHDFVFCSDGGGLFKNEEEPDSHLITRLKRANDVIDRQSRALRKRMLIGAFQRGEYGGSYWGLHTDIRDYPLTPRACGYVDASLDAIGAVRTDLDVFHPGEQAVLMNHGWLLAGAALQAHCPDWPARHSQPPDAALLDNSAALEALNGH